MIDRLIVKHCDHVSTRSFEEVVAAFEVEPGGVEDPAVISREVAAATSQADFEGRIRDREGRSGFTPFLTNDHGSWMSRRLISGRFLGAAALLCVSLVLGGAAIAGAPKEFRVSSTPVVMEHVTTETSTSYQLVTSRLDDEVKRFDESYRELLRDNKIDELRLKLTHGLEPDGFMIHFVAEQGGLLALEGKRQQGNVYYLGNVLDAAQMTTLNFGAALYAPLRLNVYENARGGTTFEYDKPSTQFGQFHNADIDKVARSLDDHLLRLIKKVSA